MSSFVTVVYGRRGDRPHEHLRFALFRLAAVTAAVVVAAALERRPSGNQLAPTVTAVVLAGVSVLASWAVPIGLASLAAAAALWIDFDDELLRYWLPEPVRRYLRLAILQLNRQLGHVEALFSWAVIAIVQCSHFTFQVAGVGTLLAFGPHLVDSIGWWRMQRPRARRRHASVANGARAKEPPGDHDRARSELHRMRRPIFYGSTLLAQGAFYVLAPPQFGSILPLVLAVVLGMLVRAIGFHRLSHEHEDHLRAVANGRRFDRALFALVAVVAVAVALHANAGAVASLGRTDGAWRARRWTSCAEPPPAPALSLFLVADPHVHALDGAPSGLQGGIVDSVVPVALRPVELDLLSGATLRHFAAIYRGLGTTGQKPQWVHLGDLGDVGCRSEIATFKEYAKRFGAPPIASPPGNHDLTFMGNVFWHPEWPNPCKEEIADRTWAKGELRTLAPGDDPHAPGAAAHFSDEGESFDAAVVTLGTIAGDEVLGVFLDTTDYGVPDLGLAGAQGSISDGQIAWIFARLREHEEARLQERRDLRVVLFLHHPAAELSSRGLRAVGWLRAHLKERLVLLVSAHTHLAAWRSERDDGASEGWWAPEFVLGSTLDPPQEVALLQMGALGDGSAWANVRTLAAVQRTGPAASPPQAGDDDLTCGPAPAAITGERCTKLVKDLPRERPACAGLFEDDGGARFRDAVEVQDHCSPCLDPRPDADGVASAARALPALPPECGLQRRLFRFAGQASFGLLRDRAAEARCDQQRRAWELLRCLSDDPEGKRIPALPLDVPGLPEQIASLHPDPDPDSVPSVASAMRDRRDTLVCLGWAASVLQERKRENWTFSQALKLAFEKGATFGELSATSVAPRPSPRQAGPGP